ncbi:oxysterol-binding protein-related protein 2 isoform X1 [Diabrotica virgifera virgifera]|uniref:Oxysterol-binding protein n=1 Tax=Diabrotica virgifera virgifera TaxID=50390 RepID=A0ABM5JH32_DIAVI|nr:oxysterol-binding protein-related protein 2 isoform X1 [Diabrotica virgifera virgifera]
MEQAERQYRKCLPVPMYRNEFTSWQVLKNCIGKELTTIAMPVVYNEPLSFLQRLAEYMEYAYLLRKAAEQEDPIERIQLVIGFAVSALASNWDRLGKPFNPLLGETFELKRAEFKMVCEQVSHHPPVSAFHAEGEGWIFHGSIHPKLSFWGKNVEIQPQGVITVEFPKLKEAYWWSNVKCIVHNIIVGKLWMEQIGKMEINSYASDIKAYLHFKAATVKEAKHLWKKLRDGHRQAISKKKPATGQAEIDTRPWKYEKLMEFLLPYISNRSKSTNIMSSRITRTNTVRGATQSPGEDLELHEEIKTETIDEEPANTYRPKRKNDNILDYLQIQQTKRNKRSSEPEVYRREFLNQSEVKSPKLKTATEKFFDSMCDMSMTLPEYVQIKIQRQIFQTVMKAREEHLESQPGTSGLVGLSYPKNVGQSGSSASSGSRPSSALSHSSAVYDVLSLQMENPPATSPQEFPLSE